MYVCNDVIQLIQVLQSYKNFVNDMGGTFQDTFQDTLESPSVKYGYIKLIPSLPI